ncbi:MAG: AEC family transporter [Microcoleaceae cyanobacterium]
MVAMSSSVSPLIQLYQWLIGGVLCGWILGRLLPRTVPADLGQFLFWVGVPVGVVIFMRQADLSGNIWLAPLVAWIAISSGAGLAWIWIQHRISGPVAATSPPTFLRSQPTQGSFLLASMVGNTGYIGYPVVLALVGSQYFGWAVFYDGLGSTIGAYGFGVALAARFGQGTQNPWELFGVTLRNPTFWSLWFGLSLRSVSFPNGVEQGLDLVGWSVIGLSLVLMGMRLSQLSSLRYLKPAAVSILIKMLIVPLVLGTGLALMGLRGEPLLVLVLQMATPPAFATLVLAETFNLDREFTVTALALGSVGLLLTLPVWLFLFG